MAGKTLLNRIKALKDPQSTKNAAYFMQRVNLAVNDNSPFRALDGMIMSANEFSFDTPKQAREYLDLLIRLTETDYPPTPKQIYQLLTVGSKETPPRPVIQAKFKSDNRALLIKQKRLLSILFEKLNKTVSQEDFTALFSILELPVNSHGRLPAMPWIQMLMATGEAGMLIDLWQELATLTQKQNATADPIYDFVTMGEPSVFHDAIAKGRVYSEPMGDFFKKLLANDAFHHGDKLAILVVDTYKTYLNDIKSAEKFTTELQSRLERLTKFAETTGIANQFLGDDFEAIFLAMIDTLNAATSTQARKNLFKAFLPMLILCKESLADHFMDSIKYASMKRSVVKAAPFINLVITELNTFETVLANVRELDNKVIDTLSELANDSDPTLGLDFAYELNAEIKNRSYAIDAAYQMMINANFTTKDPQIAAINSFRKNVAQLSRYVRYAELLKNIKDILPALLNYTTVLENDNSLTMMHAVEQNPDFQAMMTRINTLRSEILWAQGAVQANEINPVEGTQAILADFEQQILALTMAAVPETKIAPLFLTIKSYLPQLRAFTKQLAQSGDAFGETILSSSSQAVLAVMAEIRSELASVAGLLGSLTPQQQKILQSFQKQQDRVDILTQRYAVKLIKRVKALNKEMSEISKALAKDPAIVTSLENNEDVAILLKDMQDLRKEIEQAASLIDIEKDVSVIDFNLLHDKLLAELGATSVISTIHDHWNDIVVKLGLTNIFAEPAPGTKDVETISVAVPTSFETIKKHINEQIQALVVNLTQGEITREKLVALNNLLAAVGQLLAAYGKTAEKDLSDDLKMIRNSVQELVKAFLTQILASDKMNPGQKTQYILIALDNGAISAVHKPILASHGKDLDKSMIEQESKSWHQSRGKHDFAILEELMYAVGIRPQSHRPEFLHGANSSPTDTNIDAINDIPSTKHHLGH